MNLYKKATDNIASDKGTWASTLNPLSFFTGGTDKIPSFVQQLAPAGYEKETYMAFKMGAVGLLAAAVAGGIRSLRYLKNKDELLRQDNPNKYTTVSLNTTVDTPLAPKAQIKKASLDKKADPDDYNPNSIEVEEPSTLDLPTKALLLSLPTAAVLWAGLKAYKAVDKAALKTKSKLVDKQLEQKQEYLRQLTQARILLAKDNIKDAEINKLLCDHYGSDALAKQASGKDDDENSRSPGPIDTATAALAALTVLVAGLSAYGAYHRDSKNNPNNLKYKAMKQGLEAYTREKALNTPLTVLPSDANEYFKKLDAVTPKGDGAYIPSNSPVSMSF